MLDQIHAETTVAPAESHAASAKPVWHRPTLEKLSVATGTQSELGPNLDAGFNSQS